MKILAVLAVLLLFFSSSVCATIDLADIGVGARALGLGNTSAAGMDDASAIFRNPAGLALNTELNIISMSGSLLNDVNYLLVGVSDHSPAGKLGVGYLNASVGGIPITTITGSGSTAAVVQTGTTDYNSSIVFFSYGTELSRIFRGKGENVSFGASLKWFLQGFQGGGTSMQDAVGTGMDADAGFVWDVNPWSRVGLSFNNFLPYDFGGRFIWTRNEEMEPIPMVVRFGGAVKAVGRDAFFVNEEQAVNLLLDYEAGRDNRPGLWHTGLEYWPVDMLAFRLGIDQKPRGDEAGIGVDSNLTAGVGVKYMGFTFDYAYHQFGELADNATHFFSIGYRGSDRPRKRTVKPARRKAAIPVPQVVPKPDLVTYADLPEDYWAKKPIEYLATLGIMGGYPDLTFRPEKVVTRAELAVILVKAKGLAPQSASDVKFKDIKSQNWYAPYVSTAVQRGYLKGYPDKTFRPDQRITRAEASLIFARFAGLYVKPKVMLQVYPDVKKKHWASPAIAAGKQQGFYEYLGVAKFGADEFLTRAEAAEVLSKTPSVKAKIKELISGE